MPTFSTPPVVAFEVIDVIVGLFASIVLTTSDPLPAELTLPAASVIVTPVICNAVVWSAFPSLTVYVAVYVTPASAVPQLNATLLYDPDTLAPASVDPGVNVNSIVLPTFSTPPVVAFEVMEVIVGVFASITRVFPLDDAVADTFPALSVNVIPVASGFVASGCPSITVYVPV